MAEKGYQLGEEAVRRTAEAVRKVEGMLQGRRGHRATGPRGSGGGTGGGRIVRITGAAKDGDGYQDAVIADYQSGGGDEILVYNFLTAQPALPSGSTAFYHAELLTEAPAGSPTTAVYGLAYSECP